MSICRQKGSSFAGKVPSSLKGNFALGLQDQPICKHSLPGSTQEGWARNKTSPELEHHAASSVHQVSVCHLLPKEMLHFPSVCDALRENPQPAWQGARGEFWFGKCDRNDPITKGREGGDSPGGGLGDEKRASMCLLTLWLVSCLASSFPHQWNREILIIIINQCRTQKENNE